MISVYGIGDKSLMVGNKDEYHKAINLGMAIVCATNTGGMSFRDKVGKVKSDSPDYLYKDMGNEIYLNLIDGLDPKYISDKLIDKAMDFIDRKLPEQSVFIYCSQGQSRAPSVAYMYLLHKGVLKPGPLGVNRFKQAYPGWFPGEGIKSYFLNRFWK